MHKLKILTWHVHGSYLYYLSFLPVELYIPVKDKEEGYSALGNNFFWRKNIHEIYTQDIAKYSFDCIIYQSKKNYLEDQFQLLSSSQRNVPKVYIEHDPPRDHPTDTKHIVADTDIFLIHVTHFNKLMWDSGTTRTAVVEHGVVSPKNISYQGVKERGLVMVNNLKFRGRRLGYDLFKKIRKEIPLDIIGIGSEEIGGIGEIPHKNLPKFLSQYRFFFNPIRYTSLGLSVIEAMMVGLPIVAFATTEMPTVIENDVSGYIDTNVSILIQKMDMLLKDKEKARILGEGARKKADKRFSIKRFTNDWMEILSSVTSENTLPEINDSRKSVFWETFYE